MIGYVTIGTNQFERSLEFYTELMYVVDESILWRTDNMAAWASSRDETALCIVKPFNGETASSGNGVMIALKVNSKEMVNLVHSKAIELGGNCDGAPGPRGSGGFYGGYFRDLDENKLNVYIPAFSAKKPGLAED
jgi:predicted lactoylglutathione lyase